MFNVLFRPLIIRKCLQNYSSVLWLDATQRLTSREEEEPSINDVPESFEFYTPLLVYNWL